MQHTYCNYGCFEYISLYQDDEPSCEILNKILFDYSDVAMDLAQEEIETQAEENPFLMALIKRTSYGVFGCPDFFSGIDTVDFSLDNYAKDFFILEKDEAFCEEKRASTGTMVLSSENYNYVLSHTSVFKKVLKRNDKIEIVDGGTKTVGWKCLIRQKNVFPSNAAILMDNYLFKDHGDYKEENIFPIIDCLMTQNLSQPFQLTIVTDNREFKITEDRGNEIINEIKERYNSKEQTRIEITLVTHSNNPDIHKRILVTNYHYFWSDRGFKIFKDEVVKHSTDINISWVYQSITMAEADVEIIHRERYLKLTKDQIDTSNGNARPEDFVIGDKKNRLL